MMFSLELTAHQGFYSSSKNSLQVRFSLPDLFLNVQPEGSFVTPEHTHIERSISNDVANVTHIHPCVLYFRMVAK